MAYTERGLRRVKCSSDDEAGYMVNGTHVDAVCDVWSAPCLDGTLEHADEEVIGICGWESC